MTSRASRGWSHRLVTLRRCSKESRQRMSATAWVRRCRAFAICSIGSDPKVLPEPPLQLACRSTAPLS